MKTYKDVDDRWNCNLPKKRPHGPVVFMTCILSVKGKDSSECLSKVWLQEYCVLFDDFEAYGELTQQTLPCVSVFIATLTSKIKTCSVRLMFIDCFLFRTDHCPTSFTLKGFLHMVNI